MTRSYRGGDDFSDSNTIIAKMSFLILVLILFIVAVGLGIQLISYFLQPRATTYLVYGLQPGTTPKTITQDPSSSESITVWRSNNKNTGIEFTWHVWLNISDVGSSANSVYQHIFNKGGNGSFNGPSNTPGAGINNAPGVYLSPNSNTIRILMDILGNNTTQTSPAFIDIDNVPLKKWFHLAIRLENTLLDVYVNGTISARLQLQNVPKQNYDNVYVCNNGGFSGQLSNLTYLSHAANVYEISKIVLKGPNTTSYDKTSSVTTDYLSTAWYASKL